MYGPSILPITGAGASLAALALSNGSGLILGACALLLAGLALVQLGILVVKERDQDDEE